MASINAKGHHHEWQSKPPDGKLEWSKTWDERYWDEEELAANFMYSSPEEISRLKNLLKQDPGFENSSSWPHLTEWCSTCTATRSMKLVLPEEEAKVPMEEEEEVVKKEKNMEVEKEKEYGPREGVSSSGSPIFTLRNSQTGASTPPPKPQTPWPDAPEEVCILQDASTQTPKQKLRRRGGRESRTRRLLAFQAMLTVKRGLPMSRLLSEKKTDARSSKEDFLKLQEESASPALKMRKEKEKVVKKEKNMEVVKEKEYCPREGVSSSGSPIFTLRNSQTGASTPPPKPQTPWPDTPPFPPPPLFTSPLLPPNQTPQYCATPAANWGFCGGCHCWGPVLPIWVAQ